MGWSCTQDCSKGPESVCYLGMPLLCQSAPTQRQDGWQKSHHVHCSPLQHVSSSHSTASDHSGRWRQHMCYLHQWSPMLGMSSPVNNDNYHYDHYSPIYKPAAHILCEPTVIFGIVVVARSMRVGVDTVPVGNQHPLAFKILSCTFFLVPNEPAHISE